MCEIDWKIVTRCGFLNLPLVCERILSFALHLERNKTNIRLFRAETGCPPKIVYLDQERATTDDIQLCIARVAQWLSNSALNEDLNLLTARKIAQVSFIFFINRDRLLSAV